MEHRSPLQHSWEVFRLAYSYVLVFIYFVTHRNFPIIILTVYVYLNGIPRDVFTRSYICFFTENYKSPDEIEFYMIAEELITLRVPE